MSSGSHGGPPEASDSPPKVRPHSHSGAPDEGTAGSGTRPEGRTQKDAAASRPGVSSITGDPLIGQVILERYRVVRRIGSGGMGAVYIGEQLAVGREVALKVLRADLLANEHVRQRFRREAEIIGRLAHPNTIQLIDYGETPEGVAVMVTELLRGTPLNERLKKDGPMDIVEVLRLGEEVARSLSEAHQQGLVHRDLKPANIFLIELGDAVHAKVLDFGIARLLDEEATRLTTTGQVFGTPRYMSPEQAISTAEVDPRSDVYSLGLILYEGLVGQPPFVAQTSLQYLSAHTTLTPPKLRERYPAAPAALEALIDACLEKDPHRRPQTAMQLADGLAEIRREVEGTSIPMRSGRLGPAVEEAVSLTSVTESGTRWRRPSVEEGQTAPSPRLLPAWLVPVSLLVAVVLGLGAWAVGLGPFGQGVKPLDSAVAVLTPDMGLAAPTEGIDAGGPAGKGDVSIDVGVTGPAEPVEEEERAGVEKSEPRGSVKSPTTPRKKRVKGPAPGAGAVTGPRGMVIDIGEGATGEDLVELAQSCRTSVWRGTARLRTEGCPKDCALLIDEQCGGRTPARGLAVAPGRRDIAVVCGERVLRVGSLQMDSRRTTKFSCR